MKQAVDRIARRFETLTPETVDQLGEVYAPDARFVDPFNDVHGLEEVKRIYRHMYLSLESPRFVITGKVVDADQCFLTWDFNFRFRSFHRGTNQTIRGATHLRLNADGLIELHRDYWDAAQELYEKIPVISVLMRWLRRRANT